ncbi:MAG: ABC transporter substrate-binding protein [Candidatus Rokuibacteriota bacterium]
MNIQRGLLFTWALLVALLTAWTAMAGAPTDQLQPAVEQVIRTLEDPALKGPGRSEERQRALRAVADEIFDWTEMARRALGRHWQDRSPAEQQEFVGLFRALIERAYGDRIDQYSGEKVRFAGDTVDGDQATVRTKVTAKSGQETAVDYRLLRSGDRWRVYDVAVEGVSLVANYRTQFNEVIRTSSYAELVKKLKSRTS